MPDDNPPHSAGGQGYTGAERRCFDGALPPACRVIGRARASSAGALQYRGVRQDVWYPVLDFPVERLSAPLPGHIWLDDGGRVRQVVAALFDLEAAPPAAPS
jgi:hypothetical protein